jgi:L-fuculose-phosphate aldolase
LIVIFDEGVFLYEDLKKRIVEVLVYLESKGLNYGRSGNISVRASGEHIVITPSGLVKSKLKPEDLVIVDYNGEIVEGFNKPSSELPLHLAIYRAYEYFNAIIHAHSIYTGILSVMREPLPPILEEMTIYLGGDIRVTDYAPFGTRELAENSVEALRNRKAVILANHGVVACGIDLEDALEVLELVERAAQIYVFSRLTGRVTTLPVDVVEHQKKIFLERIKLRKEQEVSE